jgi:hypothetical protein
MKALGAPQDFVPKLVIIQSFVLSISGLMLGMLVFFPLMKVVEKIAPEVSVSTSIYHVIIISLGVMFISLISSLYPISKLKQIYPNSTEEILSTAPEPPKGIDLSKMKKSSRSTDYETTDYKLRKMLEDIEKRKTAKKKKVKEILIPVVGKHTTTKMASSMPYAPTGSISIKKAGRKTRKRRKVHKS